MRISSLDVASIRAFSKHFMLLEVVLHKWPSQLESSKEVEEMYDLAAYIYSMHNYNCMLHIGRQKQEEIKGKKKYVQQIIEMCRYIISTGLQFLIGIAKTRK